MRRILTLLLAFCTLLAVGCGSDDSPTGNTTGNGSVTAKVNGGNWSATNISGTYSGTDPNKVLAIGASEISGSMNRQFNITAIVSGTGTYQFTLLGPNSVMYSEGSGAGITTYRATGGSLVVDEVSASGAKGTFTCEAQEQILGGGQGSRTVSITEGKFDVTF
jgi:hypothetical protein